MDRMRTVCAAVGLAALSACAPLAQSQAIRTQRVAFGLTRPIFVTHARGDYARIFIIEKQGRIRILRNGAIVATPFLNIDPLVGGGQTNQSEQGLLGLAFHPQYSSNGYFFVNYTDNGGNTIVARYRVSADPDVADPASAFTILTVAQPFANHNGGWMDFGPDGHLYIALGDGGDANDPGNRAQTISNQLLGKMLRIDVDGADNVPGNGDDDAFPADALRNYAIPANNPFVGATGDDEIWCYGLRNPWRCSFDRLTGDLWIADVGQDLIEEVNFQPASSAGGENYGWRCMEGLQCTGLSGCTCNAASLTMPVYTYPHPDGFAVTGGYVYRGCAIPGLQGTYFFADYVTSRIWSFRYVGGAVTQFTERTAELAPGGGLILGAIGSFGEDAYGELYICDQNSEVYKILPVAAIVDCNTNAIADACDIASGASPDVNNNGVPDECECVADLNADNQTNEADLGILLAAWQAGAGGDVNDDGLTNEADLGVLLSNWQCSR